MRLGVVWASSVASSVLDLDVARCRLGVVYGVVCAGFRCGSASLGRRLWLELDAAPHLDSVVACVQWLPVLCSVVACV